MLGRQQIATIPTAMSELFKNAYDAYALEVRADYYRAEHLLVLRDNGIGMSNADFLERWLTVGTDSKTPGGTKKALVRPANVAVRRQMGEKGIGRLAIASIAPMVFVATRATDEETGLGSASATVALIPWTLFETPGLTLEDVEVPVSVVEIDQVFTATTLRSLTAGIEANLKQLDKQVPLSVSDAVRAQIERANEVDLLGVSQLDGPKIASAPGTMFLLIATGEDLEAALETPEDSEGVSAFQRFLSGFSNSITKSPDETPIVTKFFVHEPDGQQLDLISPHLFWSQDDFDNVDHVVTGTFNADGVFTGTVGVYQGEPLDYTLSWGRPDSPRCGSFKISLGVLQGTQTESRLPAEEFSLMQARLNAQGGIYIYRDDIRVLPYGNSDVDYLEIEKRRTQRAGTAYFSHRRMFGAIEVSSATNTGLQEKAGREGFRDTGAFRDFVAILKNFLTHLAADFFVEGGENSDTFEGQRDRLRRRASSRSAKEKAEREQRKRFSQALEKSFRYVEGGAFDKDLETFAERLERKIEAGKRTNLPAEQWRLIENEMIEGAKRLKARSSVRRPQSLALTAELERDYEGFVPLEDRCRNRVDEVTSALAGQIEASSDSTSNHSLLRERRASYEEKARESLEAVQLEERQTIESLNEIAAFTRGEIAQVLTTTVSKLERLRDQAATAGGSGEFMRLETKLDEIAEEGTQKIVAIRRSIERLTADADLILDNRLLQERVLDLEDQADNSVELMQLGLAVQIVNHEFAASIAAVRSGLRRLQPWAKANPELNEISRDLRGSFQHLDGYLRLFTPLQRRLYRTAVQFSGNDLLRFTRGVFAERLERHQIRLSATSEFRAFEITGYPSSFYPVMVNLIDNAIYWIGTTRQEDGRIVLDVSGGAVIISDNGPGVRPRDAVAVFERGFSRRRSGRGLGLALSKETLAREGWDLDILTTDEPDAGATFLMRPFEKETPS